MNQGFQADRTRFSEHSHTKGAFYEAFEPKRARQPIRRISFALVLYV